MSSEYLIRTRLTILFLTVLSLAVASLDSANTHFAVILRDRARSDYVNTSDGILDNEFQSLQNRVLVAAVLSAIAATTFAIYGAVITVNLRWLRDHERVLEAYAVFLMILALTLIATGGYLANNVHGFQTSFEKFGANDSIPYRMMYYGGVAQAAYGSVLIFFTALFFVFRSYGSTW